MSEDWHRVTHPHRVTVSASEKGAVKAKRPDLNGTIVVVEEGGSIIHVDCSDARDAVLIKCSCYLGII